MTRVKVCGITRAEDMQAVLAQQGSLDLDSMFQFEEGLVIKDRVDGIGAALKRVADAGGICSLAHPGTTQMDGLLPALVAAGLAAIEVRHPDHDADTEARYRALAKQYGLAMSGGSDFHARPSDDPSRSRHGEGRQS